jgi:hypothetical protein
MKMMQNVLALVLILGSVGCNLAPPPAPARTAEQQAMMDRLATMGPAVPRAGDVITRFCQEEWPGNSEMQAHCRETQRAAHQALTERPMRTTGEREIRVRCQEEWPENFQMQQHCETQRLRDWRHQLGR